MTQCPGARGASADGEAAPAGGGRGSQMVVSETDTGGGGGIMACDRGGTVNQMPPLAEVAEAVPEEQHQEEQQQPEEQQHEEQQQPQEEEDWGDAAAASPHQQQRSNSSGGGGPILAGKHFGVSGSDSCMRMLSALTVLNPAHLAFPPIDRHLLLPQLMHQLTPSVLFEMPRRRPPRQCAVWADLWLILVLQRRACGHLLAPTALPQRQQQQQQSLWQHTQALGSSKSSRWSRQQRGNQRLREREQLHPQQHLRTAGKRRLMSWRTRREACCSKRPAQRQN